MIKIKGKFSQRWRAEAIRLGGDVSAESTKHVRGVKLAQADSPENRLLLWSEAVAEEQGQSAAVQRWQQRIFAAGLVLALFALAGGFSAALAVLGDGARSVNILWATGALLGLNLVMLLLWCVGMLINSDGALLGRFLLWVNSFLQKGQGGNLTQSLLLLSHRAGVTQWAFGLVSHVLWLVAMLGVVAGLLLALALRSYVFAWETTILSPQAFAGAIDLLSALPALLGVPIPDAGSIADVTGVQTDAARRNWAAWLTGVVVVYGVLPRLVLLLLSMIMVVRGLRRVTLQIGDPFWAELLTRLQPVSERGAVTDPAPAEERPECIVPYRGPVSGLPVVIGFEVTPEQAPLPLQSSQLRVFYISSRDDRQRLQAGLEAQPPARMLVVFDARLTPDRGTLSWLVAAGSKAAALRVQLTGSESAATERLQSWREGLSRIGVLDLVLDNSIAASLQWAETGL